MEPAYPRQVLARVPANVGVKETGGRSGVHDCLKCSRTTVPDYNCDVQYWNPSLFLGRKPWFRRIDRENLVWDRQMLKNERQPLVGSFEKNWVFDAFAFSRRNCVGIGGTGSHNM